MKGATEVKEESFAARALMEAESAALRGDFLIFTRREAEARALLQTAVQLDPSLGSAYGSLGFLEFNQGHNEEAKKWFTQAVKLDAQSWLAHYYFAVLTIQGTEDAEPSAQVEMSLRNAIKINPTFAPAYNALGAFLGNRGESLDEAHKLALHAVQLEPGNIQYRLTVVGLLLRMHRPDDAVRVAEKALGMAKTKEEAAVAQAQLDNARQYMEYQAARKKWEEERKATEQAPLDQAQVETPFEVITQQPEDPAPPRLRHRDDKRRGPRKTAQGKIGEVICSFPAGLDLSLETAAGTLRFHADSFLKVEYRTVNFTPTGELEPCTQLTGMKARIIFFQTDGQDDVGELVAIELQK